MIWKILGLFVNPLTADDKNCLLKRGDSLQHFQMHLSEKRKTFSHFFFFFVAFSKFRFNFEHFQKKDDAHRSCIFELTDSETRV